MCENVANVGVENTECEPMRVDVDDIPVVGVCEAEGEDLVDGVGGVLALGGAQVSGSVARDASLSLQEESRGSVCLLCGFQAEGRRRLGAHIRSAHSLAPEAQIRRMDFRRCGVGGCAAIIAVAPNSLNQHLQTRGAHRPMSDNHPVDLGRLGAVSTELGSGVGGFDGGWA